MFIGELNLENVKSQFYNTLNENNDSSDETKSLFVPYIISEELLHDFNTRNFNPKNINDILSLCDFLMIENTIDFILEHNLLTQELYVLNERHKENYKWPEFLSDKKFFTGVNICKYDSMRWLEYACVNEDITNLAFEDILNEGYIKFVKYLFFDSNISTRLQIIYKHNYISKEISPDIICEKGHFECLKFCIDNKLFANVNICETLIKYNHLECLKYALDYYTKSVTYIQIAAERGHIDCLKFLHEQDSPWTHTALINAAEYGHLNCLKYGYEHGIQFPNNIINVIAHTEHIDCLKYVIDNGCEITDNCIIIAIQNDKLNMLKCMFEYGFVMSETFADVAIRHGKYYCLKFLYEHGCMWSNYGIEIAVNNGQFGCLKYICNSQEQMHPYYEEIVCSKYAKCVKFVLNKYAPFGALTADYLHEQYNISTIINVKIIQCNDLEYFKYFISLGFTYDTEEIVEMASYGSLNLLKYAYKYNDDRDEMICAHAARNGHLDCLKFLHEHGYNWSITTRIMAQEYNQVKCLKYLDEHSCP
mgnify:FL=1